MQHEKSSVLPSGKWHDCVRLSTLLIVAAITTSVLFCTGCASCRNAQKTMTELSERIDLLQQTQAQMTESLTKIQADTTTQHLVRLLDSQMDKDEEVETTTEVFDTTLPVDSLTGTPPLKSRTTEHRRTKTQEQATASEQLDTQSGSMQTTEQRHEEQTVTDTAIEGDTHIEVEQRYGMNWLQKTLCYIGIAAIVLLLLWIAWRLLKRYLTII